MWRRFKGCAERLVCLSHPKSRRHDLSSALGRSVEIERITQIARQLAYLCVLGLGTRLSMSMRARG